MNEIQVRRIVNGEIKKEISENNKIIFAEMDKRFSHMNEKIGQELDTKFETFRISINKNFDRTVRVVGEDFVSQVRFIAEQVQTINENTRDNKKLKEVVDNHEHRLSKAGL